MAAKIVMMMFMMLVGALAIKYNQISDALATSTAFVPLGFHALQGNGWCVDSTGQEATARTETLSLSCPNAQTLCEKDSMCVAFACISSGNHAVLYTTTNCAFGCDRLDWIHHPKQIVAAGYDSSNELYAAWDEGVCYVSEAARKVERSADSTTCDFEHDICGWSPVSDHKWFRASGTNHAADTGPHAAHSGTGFVLVDSSGANSNSKFILESPSLSNYATSSDQVLLHFWYHMMGSGMGDLSLACSTDSQSSRTIWQQKGQQAKGWTEVMVEIPQGTCQFEADTGPNDQSDIALDDITITKSAPNRNCTFESEDLCGMWEITPGVESPGPGWSRSTGEYALSETGPSQAADGQGKYYLYVNSRGNNSPGKTFYLKSKPFRSIQASKIEFKYHMYGAGMGTLALNIKKQDGSTVELWKKSGSQQNSATEAWLDAAVDIPVEAEMIEFVATTKDGDRTLAQHGDMAIDDITFAFYPEFAA